MKGLNQKEHDLLREIAEKNILKFSDSFVTDNVCAALSIYSLDHEILEKCRKYVYPIEDDYKTILSPKSIDIAESYLKPGAVENPNIDYFIESSFRIFDIQSNDKIAYIIDSKVGPFFYNSSEFEKSQDIETKYGPLIYYSCREYEQDILKCQEYVTCTLNAAETITYRCLKDLLAAEERFDKIILGHIENEEVTFFNQNIKCLFDKHLKEGGKVVFSVANHVLNYAEGDALLPELAFRNYLIESRYVSAVREYKCGAYVICSKENNNEISMSFGSDKLKQVEDDAYYAVINNANQEKCEEYFQMRPSDVASILMHSCPSKIKYEDILPNNVLSPKFYWANEAFHTKEGESIDFLGNEIVTSKLFKEIEYEDKYTPQYFYEIVQYGPSAVQNFVGQYIVSGLYEDYTKVKNLTGTCLEERLSRGYVIKNDCMLVRFQKSKSSFGYVSQLKDIGVEFLYSDIHTIPFKRKGEDLDEKYLLRILQNQIESQLIILKDVNHTNDSYLTPWAFMSLKIRYPKDLNKQKKLVEADYAQSVSKLEKEIEANSEEYHKTIRMRKHSIGQDLFNLKNWWKKLKEAKRNGVLKDSDLIEGFKTYEVREIFERIENSINIINEKVKRFTVGDEMEYDIISIPEFIADYISKHQSPLFCYVSEQADENHLILNFRRSIRFPREALITILDNIVSNACSHGFKDREQNNKIKIEFETQSDYLILKVSNNGCPINKTLNESDIFTWGRTTQVGYHSGIGGAEIKYLMDNYQMNIAPNERVKMVFNNSSEYPVQYVLKFELVEGGKMDMYYF